jgi:hypothetical protein
MKLSLYLLAALLALPSAKTAAQCDAVSLPYTENFENITVPALPECTSSLLATEELNNWQTGITTQNGQPNNVLLFNMLSEAPPLASAFFYGRPMLLEAGKNYRLAFDYGLSNPNISSFYIRIYLKNTETGASSQIQYLPALDQSSPGSFVSAFINTAQSGAYSLGIEIRANNMDGFFYIDNLEFREWICPIPENLAVTNVTSGSATFSWSGASPDHYQYSVVPAGEDPLFSISSGINTATRNNLEPATDYTVFVRKRCANQDGQFYWSDWSAGVNFTTLGTLGLQEIAENSFSLYPNPVNTTLNINYKNAIDTVEIYSTTGQLLLAEKPNTDRASVNIEKLSAGIYYINVSSDGYAKQIKIIKE